MPVKITLIHLFYSSLLVICLCAGHIDASGRNKKLTSTSSGYPHRPFWDPVAQEEYAAEVDARERAGTLTTTAQLTGQEYLDDAYGDNADFRLDAFTAIYQVWLEHNGITIPYQLARQHVMKNIDESIDTDFRSEYQSVQQDAALRLRKKTLA